MTTYGSAWRRLVKEAIAAGARCVDCGTDRDLEGDHDLPVSRGGLSTRANLVIRCRAHNRRKGNRVTRYQLRVPWPVAPIHTPAAVRQEPFLQRQLPTAAGTLPIRPAVARSGGAQGRLAGSRGGLDRPTRPVEENPWTR
jgi:hypothetical protein